MAFRSEFENCNQWILLVSAFTTKHVEEALEAAKKNVKNCKGPSPEPVFGVSVQGNCRNMADSMEEHPLPL